MWGAVPGRAPEPPQKTFEDLVIARENTEGLYADRNMAVGSGEFMPTPDIALAVGVFVIGLKLQLPIWPGSN